MLDLANSLYGHMLRCLVQAYGRGGGRRGGQAPLRRHRHRPDGGAAGGRPRISPRCRRASSHPGVNAGVTFTMLRDIARLPRGPGEKRMMAERVAEMAEHARAICSRRATSSPASPRRSNGSSRSSASRPRGRWHRRTHGLPQPTPRAAAPPVSRSPTICRSGAGRSNDRGRRGQGRHHPLRRQALHPCALLRARRADGVQGEHAGRMDLSRTPWRPTQLVHVAQQLPVRRDHVHAARTAGRRKQRAAGQHRQPPRERTLCLPRAD